jgi:hypothetical protein
MWWCRSCTLGWQQREVARQHAAHPWCAIRAPAARACVLAQRPLSVPGYTCSRHCCTSACTFDCRARSTVTHTTVKKWAPSRRQQLLLGHSLAHAFSAWRLCSPQAARGGWPGCPASLAPSTTSGQSTSATTAATPLCRTLLLLSVLLLSVLLLLLLLLLSTTLLLGQSQRSHARADHHANARSPTWAPRPWPCTARPARPWSRTRGASTPC